MLQSWTEMSAQSVIKPVSYPFHFPQLLLTLTVKSISLILTWSPLDVAKRHVSCAICSSNARGSIKPRSPIDVSTQKGLFQTRAGVLGGVPCLVNTADASGVARQLDLTPTVA